MNGGDNTKLRIPGKLSARPVQHPATPAFITVQKKKRDLRKEKRKGNLYQEKLV